MNVDSDPPHLSLVACYTFNLLIPHMQELITQGMQQNYKHPAFDARRTLGMSNLIIFYSLQNIWLLLLIGLHISTTILQNIDVL